MLCLLKVYKDIASNYYRMFEIRTTLAFAAIMILGTITLLGQDHFLVELENRSPGVKAQVQAYEGRPTIPILAKDTDGVEHSLASMKGKISFLWFWNEDCPKCIEYIGGLNKIQDENPNTLSVLSFSDNMKDEVIAFKARTPLSFPVIPNSKLLADGPFGGDFGYPRLFIVDQEGIVKYVIPEEEMRGNFDAYGFFDAIHRSLLKSK